MQLKKIGEILVELGYVTEEQIELALKVKKTNNSLLGEVLEDLDFITSNEIVEAISKQENLKYTNIFDEKINENTLKKIPKNFCESQFIFPIGETEEEIFIVKSIDEELYLDEYLRKFVNKKINYLYSDKKIIYKAIQFFYQDKKEAFIDKINKINNNEDIFQGEEFFELLIEDSISKRASDIHITPEEEVFYIFYRIDGVLKNQYSLKKKFFKNLENSIKIKSDIDISDTLSSADGRLSIEVLEEKYDIRVSILHLDKYGSNIVLRLLHKNSSMFNINSLGVSKKDEEKILRNINNPHGIILVTGPTGSGKTTTLYSTLRKINVLEKNILTVEDPIEYKFSLIKQTQINEEKKYTFPEAIKIFMRQDPDVILVGEIRDQETAQLATRAAITGHLVVSTVHTNNAISTIPRLLDLGIPEYMISSSLTAIISQRLVRKLCPSCKEKITISKEEIKQNWYLKNEELNNDIEIYKAVGCKFCNNTGYNGREAVIEILEINKEIQQMIINKSSMLDILEKAKENGMTTIKENSIQKLLEGKTSLEELQRVIEV